MILLDTSVFVDFLRAKDTRLRAIFVTAGATLCGVVRAEILNGATDPVNAARLSAALNALPQVPVTDAAWDMAGRTLSSLRWVGLCAGFADALIAATAVENDLELWTRDKFFTRIQSVLPALKLFAEPS